MPLSPRDLALAVAGVFALLLVVAFLVNRFAPLRRSRLRSSVLLFAVYVVSAVVLFAARSLGAEPALRWLDFAARMSGGFTAVNLLALLLVHVIFPRLRLPLPAIMGDLLSALGYAVIAAVVISDTGINPTSAVAGGTVIAAVLSISLQSTLGNVIGGVALQVDGSIGAGDWVQLDSGRQGRVQSINWRHTVLETRDGDSIIMPNSVLLSQPFTILARRDGRAFLHRQAVHFRVDFRFAPSRVCKVVVECLQAAPLFNVSKAPEPDCVCLDLGKDGSESTALYAVRYWVVDLMRDTPTDSDVRDRVHAALRRNGIPIALPASTVFNATLVHLSGDAQRQRRNDRAFATVRGVELFRTITDEECAQLAASLTFCPFAMGEIITRQGATAHYLYLLASGRAEVRVATDGVESTVAIIDAPGFFGEMGLLTGAPRIASVYAQVACDCYKLEAAAFEEILRKRPEVANGVADRLAARQVEFDAAKQGLDMASRTARVSSESAQIARRIRDFFGLQE